MSNSNDSPQIASSSNNRPEADADDEIAPQMMASYCEISDPSGEGHDNDPEQTPTIPARPLSLACNFDSAENKPLDLDGQVIYEGDMTHFVADDLEYKIKLSSPISKKSDGSFSNIGYSKLNNPHYRHAHNQQVGQVDMTVLNDLEHEARKIAQSVDNLIENLSGVLHSISSITADNVEVYKDSVSKTCDSIDSNIKCMYTILAKGEEVFQAMGPVQVQAARISEIRRLLNLFENTI